MSSKNSLLAACVVAVSTHAYAGDLPSRPASPVYLPPPPIFTWTGFYVGGQAGYQFGTTSITALGIRGAVLPQPGYSPNGFVGGAHLGYNYQIAQFVVGLEGDVDGSTYRGSGFNAAGVVDRSTDIPVESSLRGRFGMALEHALVYATGGAAFGSIRNVSVNTISGGTDTFDITRVGWTAGGGVEYALTNNWSVRAEYRYTDFGSFNEFLANSTVGLITAHRHETDNAVRAGFSYKFDAFAPLAPTVAKY